MVLGLKMPSVVLKNRSMEINKNKKQEQTISKGSSKQIFTQFYSKLQSYSSKFSQINASTFDIYALKQFV